LVFFKGLGLVLLLVAIVFTPLFGLYYLIRYIVGFFSKSVYGRKIHLKYAELTLSSKFEYYQKLNDKNKTKFLRRLLNFIDEKEFHGSGGLQLTDEMIVLISASAIQLTFGLDEYRLEHFSKIFVYPKAYYSKISKQYHKGETNLGGAIALSWSHFTEGYNKPNDKVNLGLHEMAHALRFDKFKSDDYDEFFNTYYDKWQIIAKEEFTKTKENKISFFREYGGTNLNEFFAVCVESFFESPAEFKKMHPGIYRHMCVLLNQDPLSDPFSHDENNIRSMNSRFLQPPGEAFYISGNNSKKLMAFIYAVIAWSVFLFTLNKGFSLDIVILLLIMLPLGYFATVRAFSKVYFYESGMLIRSFIPDVINQQKELSYDEIICVEFSKGSDEYDDTMKVIFLSDGKIKSRSFSDVFAANEVLKLADILHSKKVALKLNEFASKRSRN
jgi:Mlc titration factor MtfA (ptsG expression regulator)